MYIERDLEKEIVPWLESPEVIAIRGPRQSGKTTLLKKIAERLEQKNKKVHFLSLESDLERKKFEEDPKQYFEYYFQPGSKNFFLLDEVQYVKDAGKILKLIFDDLPQIKIIITGSSTLDLNKIGSSLVGRVLFFELYPFSFAEFLKAKDEKLHQHFQKYKIRLDKPSLKKSIYLKELNKKLDEYLAFGGYPRVVLEKSIDKKKFILQNLFTTYLEKDVVSLYGIKYKEKVISSVKYLASIVGEMLTYNSLAEAGSLYYKEIKEILSVLEQTYVIKIVKPFHKSMVTELKKNPKIYFVDSGLRNIVVGRFEFSEVEKGHLLENYILSCIPDAKYWRTTAKAEVDFIYFGIPIEIKLKPKISRGFRSFLGHYKPAYGIVIGLYNAKKKEAEKIPVYFLPAALIKTVRKKSGLNYS
jgi:predicted AAA+ superfamily ATPase